ncbi:hypothetical protein ABW19_dt0203457 [Dactylella cylindrospora]|nr:hypothetical protein ABW19_dt0203457 [Dactylella cylindrospora]
MTDGHYWGPKVPSKIAIDATGKVHWGYLIPKGCHTFEWLKILLEPNGTSVYRHSVLLEETNRLLQKTAMTVVDLVATYLEHLWEFSKEQIMADLTEEVFNNTEKTIVLSVPAGWSEQATQSTYEAARLAGLADCCELKLISEPGAAGLHVLTISKRNNPQLVKKGDCIVVCDAGGGTVDIVTFEATNVSPHLVLEERVAPSGDLCGSVYLNLAFESLIDLKLGPRASGGDRRMERARKGVSSQFNQHTKVQVDPERWTREPFTFELKPELPDPHNPGERISDIEMSLSLLEGIFDPLCYRVMTLIEDQLEMLEEKQKRAKLLVLVGGFGDNKYLQKYLRAPSRAKGLQMKLMLGGDG